MYRKGASTSHNLIEDLLQISLLILNKFKRIKWFIFPLKLSENLSENFSDDFREHRNCLNLLKFAEICLNSLNINVKFGNHS